MLCFLTIHATEATATLFYSLVLRLLLRGAEKEPGTHSWRMCRIAVDVWVLLPSHDYVMKC